MSNFYEVRNMIRLLKWYLNFCNWGYSADVQSLWLILKWQSSSETLNIFRLLIWWQLVWMNGWRHTLVWWQVREVSTWSKQWSRTSRNISSSFWKRRWRRRQPELLCHWWTDVGSLCHGPWLFVYVSGGLMALHCLPLFQHSPGLRDATFMEYLEISTSLSRQTAVDRLFPNWYAETFISDPEVSTHSEKHPWS